MFTIVCALPDWQYLYMHIVLFLHQSKINIVVPSSNNNNKPSTVNAHCCVTTKPKFCCFNIDIFA